MAAAACAILEEVIDQVDVVSTLSDGIVPFLEGGVPIQSDRGVSDLTQKALG
jgi:hypothetical protein